MKKLLICLLVLGLIFAGCDSETDDDGDDEIIINETEGRLTLTGLSSLNGLCVIAFGGIPGENAELIAVEGFNDSNDIIGGEVSGGKVTLNVWIAEERNATPASYSGNDKNVEFKVFVINYLTVDEEQVKAIRGTSTAAALVDQIGADFDIVFGTAMGVNFDDGIGEALFIRDLGISVGG